MKITEVTTKSVADAALRTILKSKYVCIDCETKNLDPMQKESKLLTISVCTDKEESFVYGVNHAACDNIVHRSVDTNNVLKKLFDSNVKIIGHNLKYDLKWIKVTFNVLPKLENILFDTMISHSLLDENAEHSLDYLTDLYVPQYSGYYKDFYESLENKKDFETAPYDKLIKYNGMDTIITVKIYKVMEKIFNKKENQPINNILYTYSLPVMLCLIDMELNGFNVDSKKLDLLVNEYLLLRSQKEKKIISLDKSYFKDRPDFNFNSYPQLTDFIYEHLKFPVLRTTKKNHKTGSGGAPSVDIIAFEIFDRQAKGNNKKILENLISRAKLNSIIKSFLNVFVLKTGLSTDGKIRTNFNQHVVETGRLSSSDPNMQNLPTSEKLDEYGLLPVKPIFISRFNRGLILQADYSQIELRTNAMYTGDEVFIDAFKKGRDLHGELAKVIFGSDYTKEQRTKAKRTNFSAIFDIQPETLAVNLKIPDYEAKRLLDGFWNLHPAIKKWFRKVWNEANEYGYVENFNGRRRHVSEAIEMATEQWQKDKVKREVWNFPIQSSAAEITLTGLYMFRNKLINNKMKSVLFGSVHDSIYVDVFPTETKKIIALVKSTFVSDVEKYYKWINVPLVVDVSIGKDLHNLESI